MDKAGAALSALARQYYANEVNLKPISYWIEYERLFLGRRESPLRLLELGVADGASLAVWRDYLPGATIVGIDIGECPPWVAKEERVHFVSASQDDTAALDFAARQVGGAFDVIIDDASHLGYLTKRSFTHLFPNCLAAGGFYVIEDFGTAFRTEYPDAAPFVAPSGEAEPDSRTFSSHQNGMFGFIKQLQDHMMQELATGTPSRFAIEYMTLRANIAVLRKVT